MIRYTVVTGWRSPADGVAGLGGLTVQAHCLSGYSHYPPPQPPAQLSPNQRVILWLALENGNGARARSYCWRDIPSYMHIKKSTLVLVVVLFTFSIRLSQ